MSTRFSFLIAVMAGCGAKKPPPSATASPPVAEAASAEATGPHCRSLGQHGLEVCTQPAPLRSGGDLTITIQRSDTKQVLWTEVADALAQAQFVGDQDPPALQVVIVQHVEPGDAEDAEDAYYVVDMELVGGKVNEVNRFRDSGD